MKMTNQISTKEKNNAINEQATVMKNNANKYCKGAEGAF
jgi:hypothetical protein